MCMLYFTYRPKTESCTTIRVRECVRVNRTSQQHPVLLYCTLFALPLSPSIAIYAHSFLDDHYVSFAFNHFVLFVLWPIERDKKVYVPHYRLLHLLGYGFKPYVVLS